MRPSGRSGLLTILGSIDKNVTVETCSGRRLELIIFVALPGPESIRFGGHDQKSRIIGGEAQRRNQANMSAVVIVGAQWGDEGKGKIVDFYTERADWVVRYGGGPNAGHTLVVGDEKIIVRLLPSGIMRDETRCVLGQGMVIDPTVLLSGNRRPCQARPQWHRKAAAYQRSRPLDPSVSHNHRLPERSQGVRRQRARNDQEGHRTDLRGQGTPYRDPHGRSARSAAAARKNRFGYRGLGAHDASPGR